MIGFTGWYADLQKEKARLRAEHEVREAARKEANTGVRIAHGEVYINPGGGGNSCSYFPSVRILAARSKLRDRDPVRAKGKSLDIYCITVGYSDLPPFQKVDNGEGSYYYCTEDRYCYTASLPLLVDRSTSPARGDEHSGDATRAASLPLLVDRSTSPMEIFCAISTGGILQRTLCSETQMANEGSETQQIHEDDAHAPAEVSAESVANEATENVVSGAEAAENFSDVGANQSAKESNIQLESLSEPLAQVKKEKSTSELLSSESFATGSAIALNNAENVAPKELTVDGDQEQLDAIKRKIIDMPEIIDLTIHDELYELESLHTPKTALTRANTETVSSQNENETMAAVESSEQPLSAKKKKGHGRSKTFGGAIEKPSNGAFSVRKLKRSLSAPSSARNINGASGRELSVDSKTFNNDVKEILHEVHYEKEKSRSTSAFFKNLCDSLSEKNIDNLATEENLDLLWKIVALDGKECPFRKSIMALIPRNLDNLIHYFKEQVALSQGYYASDGIAEM